MLACSMTTATPFSHECMHQEFLGLTDRVERNRALSQEYWQQPDVQNELEGAVFEAVIHHIADSAQYHYRQIKSDTDKFHFSETFECSPGLRWSSSPHWSKWQARIFELRGQLNWSSMQQCIDNILSFSAFYPERYTTHLLEDANRALANGCKLQPKTLICVVHRPTYKHRKPAQALAHTPNILNELRKTEHQPEFEKIALWSPDNVTWLSHFNPQVDAWHLAERCTSKEMLKKMAEPLPDCALFKAWHGLPLNVEETTIYPLALSLYVHKHAPVYIAQVQALPHHWQMALQLAQTGAQFKDLLLQGQSKKAFESSRLPEPFPS